MVTAQSTAQPSAIQRLLPLVGIVVAIAIALGAWLLPLSWLEPESNAVPPRPTSGVALTEVGWEPIEPNAWTELIEPIEARVEQQEPARIEEDPPEPTDTTEQTTPGPEMRRPRPQWNYEGFIREPGGLVAVLRTDEGQRLFFRGDTVVHYPPGFPAVEYVVTEVTPELVRIAWDTNEFTYAIMRTAPSRTPDANSARGRRPGDDRSDITPRPGVSPNDLPGGDR
jgi:hypothetical protein